MNLKIEDILQKEMSRTEFLGLVGAGILSAVGVTALLKNLGDIFGKSTQKQSVLNYGNDSYGGGTAKSKNSLSIWLISYWLSFLLQKQM